MNHDVTRASFISAIYFSCASFIVIWLASFLFNFLEKTTGRLDMGWVIVIVLSIMVIMFFLALTNILLSHPEHSKITLFDKIIGVLLFIILSTVIVGGLGFLFWFPIG